MDILKLDIKDYIPNVIEVYTKIFGEEYRELINERIKSGEIITYFTKEIIRGYMYFLKDCKARELSIRFLGKIGIDVSKLEEKSFAEEISGNIRYLAREYIGGSLGFTYLPEHNLIGIRAFDRNVQEKNKQYSRDIIENQIRFLNFYLGEERIFDEKELGEFLKTDEFKQINIKIQEYIKIYNKIFQEYEKYCEELEKNEEIAIKRTSEKNRAILNRLNNVFIDGNSKEILDTIFEQPKIVVFFKSVKKPILFYTIRDGGFLDYIMLHEYCHLIEIPVKAGGYQGAGFDYGEEINPYMKDKRKYERLNENFTDIFASRATKMLHKKGIYMLELPGLTRNNTMDVNTSNITKKMLIPFLKDYKEEIIRARMTGDLESLFNLVGRDNFEELNDCINKVDYLVFEKELEKSLTKKEDDKVTKEYKKELQRLDKIYYNMREYSLGDEAR